LSYAHRFLDGQLKKDRAYKNLQRAIRRERDKYPDQAIVMRLICFRPFIHSKCRWVVAEYDLVGIPAFEKNI